MLQRIYLDECGYTGEDLLNDTQPVFVICTHSLSEEECSDIKARHFGGLKAQELKHSELKKRPSHQGRLLSALADLLDKSTQIKVGITHKRYALTMKIVDLIIETSMYEAGFNLYQNGGEIAFTNIMYHSMNFDPLYFDKLLQKFQCMIRERTLKQCTEFAKMLSIRHPIRLVDEFRSHIFHALRHIGFAGLFSGLSKNALDLSLSTTFHLIGMWKDAIPNAAITIIHDVSTNMAKQKFLWDALVSPSARPAVVGFDTRKKTFPLNVRETSFVSSRNSVALQIADIIAGALAHFYTAQIKEIEGKYETGLNALLDGKSLSGYVLWPSLAITPEELGTEGTHGEDPLQYIAEIIARATRKS